MNLTIEGMQIDLVLASVHKFPGSEPIIVIEDEDSACEVVLTEKEARAVHEWLGRALEQPAPETSADLSRLTSCHWDKDPLIPYEGCHCDSCEDARSAVVRTLSDSPAVHLKPSEAASFEKAFARSPRRIDKSARHSCHCPAKPGEDCQLSNEECEARIRANTVACPTCFPLETCSECQGTKLVLGDFGNFERTLGPCPKCAPSISTGAKGSTTELSTVPTTQYQR
jgi:hypothetical protein